MEDSLDKRSLLIETSPLISFLKINRFDLLEALQKQLLCSEFVAQELRRPRERFEELLKDSRIEILRITDPSLLMETEELRDRGLGRGEASSIVLAKSQSLGLIMDDKRAIKIANKLGVQSISTAEIINSLITNKLLSLEQADGFITEWHSQGEFPVNFTSFAQYSDE